MYASILPVLRCPHCGSGFELTESKKDGGEIVTGKIIRIEVSHDMKKEPPIGGFFPPSSPVPAPGA